jgi:hypothetical protein
MALDLTEEFRPFIADSVVILVHNLRVNPRARIDVGADAANRPARRTQRGMPDPKIVALSPGVR